MSADDSKRSATLSGIWALPANMGDAAEIQAIRRELVAGQITAEQARDRIMAVYQAGLGAGLRSVGETHADAIAPLVARLIDDLREVAQRYVAKSTAVPAPIARPNEPTPRLGGKRLEVLEREAALLEMLTSSAKPVLLGDLRARVQSIDPSVNEGTLLANLERLCKEEWIAKPRKGQYTLSLWSKFYLAALQAEIVDRKVE